MYPRLLSNVCRCKLAWVSILWDPSVRNLFDAIKDGASYSLLLMLWCHVQEIQPRLI